MKTIKIFLASSDELQEERIALGNLVRKLDKIYEKRGIRVDLFAWEDYDAAYNGVRKQGEYNAQIESSEMFLALFYKKAGKYTLEEFNVATESFRKHASPKVYTYCKELHDGESESPELKEFKKKLFEEMGHYWCRYNNRDSLQLHFVIQLQLVESSSTDYLSLEDGCVIFGDMPIARMESLRFASSNESYKKMQEELLALPGQIEKARSRTILLPDDEDLKEDLQKKIDRFNELQKEFSNFQKSLIDTAKKVIEMQQEHVGGMLRRAIDSFNEGDIKKANILLDEICHEADHHFEQLENSQALIHRDIDVLRLQAKTVLADLSIPIDIRINKVKTIYEKADNWAKQTKYNTKKYSGLLFEYGTFLSDFAYYNESSILLERVLLLKGEQDDTPLDTSTAMVAIGNNYYSLGEYTFALDWFLNALSLVLVILGDDHPRVATLCVNIGSTYHSLGDYQNALNYLKTAIEILEKTSLAKPDAIVAAYSNLGSLYIDMNDTKSATDTLLKGLDYLKGTLGIDSIPAAAIYHNLGQMHLASNEYNKAQEYFFKDLAICEKEKGILHPDTASCYNSIGAVYEAVGDYNKALYYYQRALLICESKLGHSHPYTVSSYKTLGGLYQQVGNTSKSLDYYLKLLESYKENPDNRDLDISYCYFNIANLYSELNNWSAALENLFKSLHILKGLYGDNHQLTMTCYNNIGVLYADIHDYRNALEYFLKCTDIIKDLYGSSHQSLAHYFGRIGSFYYHLEEYNNAIEYLKKGLENTELYQGPECPYCATLCYNLAASYFAKCEYLLANHYAIRAKSIRDIYEDGEPSLDTIDSLIAVCEKNMSSK